MKNISYQNEIIKSTEISKSIKLHSDFNESMNILGKYSVLIQFIKLTDIMSHWFDEMYYKTNDDEFLTFKDNFIEDVIGNLHVYVQTGNQIGLSPMVKDLKESLSQIFSK